MLPDFGGKYRAVRVISDRERSTTLAAIDPESGEPRFVKLANESARDDPAVHNAFLHEPAILRKLDREAGPGVVVPVVGEVPGRDDPTSRSRYWRAGASPRRCEDGLPSTDVRPCR